MNYNLQIDHLEVATRSTLNGEGKSWLAKQNHDSPIYAVDLCTGALENFWVKHRYSSNEDKER